MRAFLTRDGQPSLAPSVISWLPIDAELQADKLVCTAELSDFAASELLVAQIDVAVYAVGR